VESCGDAKFGNSWGGWCSNELVGASEVGLWTNIRRGCGKFSSHTKFEVKVGSKVRLA